MRSCLISIVTLMALLCACHKGGGGGAAPLAVPGSAPADGALSAGAASSPTGDSQPGNGGTAARPAGSGAAPARPAAQAPSASSGIAVQPTVPAGWASPAVSPSAAVVVLRTSLSASSDPCETGGQQIVTFIDINGNGTYDSGVDQGYATAVVCNPPSAIVDFDQQQLATITAQVTTAGSLIAAAESGLANASGSGNDSGSTGNTSGTIAGGGGSGTAQLAADQAALATGNAALTALAAGIDTSRIDLYYGTGSALTLTSVDDVCNLFTNAKTDASDYQSQFNGDTAETSLVAQEAAVTTAAARLSADLSADAAAAAALTSPLASVLSELAKWGQGAANDYGAATAAFAVAADGLSGQVNNRSGSLYAFNVALANAARTLGDWQNLRYFVALELQLAVYQVQFSIVQAEAAAVALEQQGGAPGSQAALAYAQAELQNANDALSQAQAAEVLAAAQLSADQQIVSPQTPQNP